MRVPVTALAFASAITLVMAACGGSSDAKPTVTTAPSATAARPTAAPSPAAESTSVSGGDSDEVTGIVGTVDTATGLIEIDRLSGAAVRRLSVDRATIYRRAGGGSTTLAGIRPSQRIVAQGTINDRGDTLLASEITVQDVIQGGQPGG